MNSDSAVLATEQIHRSMEEDRMPINKPHEYSQLTFEKGTKAI